MSGQHTLPDLPYPYEALEPFISRQIMELHHKKHHQTYVNSLNAAEQAYAKASTPKERIALQSALKFNGGGTYNVSKLSFSLGSRTLGTLGVPRSAFLKIRFDRAVLTRPFLPSPQATSTTPSSGRTLPVQSQKVVVTEVPFKMVLLRTLSSRPSVPLTSSRRPSMPLPPVSRAQVGVGS